jgi:hypothetical protein
MATLQSVTVEQGRQANELAAARRGLNAKSAECETLAERVAALEAEVVTARKGAGRAVRDAVALAGAVAALEERIAGERGKRLGRPPADSLAAKYLAMSGAAAGTSRLLAGDHVVGVARLHGGVHGIHGDNGSIGFVGFVVGVDPHGSGRARRAADRPARGTAGGQRLR